MSSLKAVSTIMVQDSMIQETTANSVYNQLLYLPVLTDKVSFSTNKVGPGKLLKAVVSRYRSDTEHATGHTRGRWRQLKNRHRSFLEFQLNILSKNYYVNSCK
jgi:hypothetical protein